MARREHCCLGQNLRAASSNCMVRRCRNDLHLLRHSVDPVPWTQTLLDIKSRVEAAAGTDFNSVLLNYYRDHRDSMGLHSDDEPELGERPILASVSLGEERTFILKHKRDKALNLFA